VPSSQTSDFPASLPVFHPQCFYFILSVSQEMREMQANEPDSSRILFRNKLHLPDIVSRAIIPIDKPLHWTSNDAVQKVKRLLGRRWKVKVGHAGTLDPLATGLLLCLVGTATKSACHFTNQSKTYTGLIKLGAVTASYDAATQPIVTGNAGDVTDADIEHHRLKFIGTIQQQARP
jgi:tRNA pseudouridine55 synthase